MRKKNFGNNLSGLLVFFKDSLHQNFIFLNSLFETQHKLTWTALFVDCNGAVPTNHMFLQSGYSWTSFKGKYFSRTKAVTPVLQSTQFRYDDRVITCQGYCILQFWSSPRKKEIIWKEVRKNHLWTEGIQSSRGLTDICTPTWINLGPLHMSVANRVGSVSEISPRRRFFRKNSHVFIWEAGLPRLPTSRFSRRRSRQPGETFSHMNTPTRVTGTKPFLRK